VKRGSPDHNRWREKKGVHPKKGGIRAKFSSKRARRGEGNIGRILNIKKGCNSQYVVGKSRREWKKGGEKKGKIPSVSQTKGRADSLQGQRRTQRVR